MQKKHTILVIEDDPTTQALLQGIISKMGESAVICEDAEKGLELISQIEPELVILDIQLPEIDGWEFFEILRRRHMRTCVLIVTSTKNNKTESFLESHDDFSQLLYKPFNGTISQEIRALLVKSYNISRKSFKW